MNDTKIKLLRKLPEGDSLLILWIGLLCLAMKSGRPGMIEIGDGLPFTDEALSVELDIPINTVRLGIETFVKFKMIELWESGETFIVNFEKHQELSKIEKAKEVSRISSQKYRERLKIGDGHVTTSDDTDKEEDQKKEKELEFEKFWGLYDKKKDKERAIKSWNRLTRKEINLAFGAVKKYVLSTKEKQYRKNLSTWLNGKCWNDEIEELKTTSTYTECDLPEIL
jgi:predicted phage replisome organizer